MATLAARPGGPQHGAMPTYQAPGVYVEETGFRAKPIEGAPTSVTAFVGPTLAVPVGRGEHPLVTSFAEFAAIYGGLDDLMLEGGGSAPNYVAHAARAFFEGGGKRLHVASTPAEAVAQDYADALAGLDELPEIAVVAAPGATDDAVIQLLVDHVETPRRYRFAVLDAPKGAALAEVRTFRARYDSQHAALYHPWVLAADPAGDGATIAQPPSGFACAIFARTDLDRGVWKAPANEVVRGAVGLEQDVNTAMQEVLNPLGINCIRALPGRGIRLWDARTISSDPEFKYVNVRRLMTYLEASLDRGLQWAVFEPNGPRLWALVVQTASDFLLELWRNGGLLGVKPEEAFFVRCDRSTMTQADIDAGRLVCLIGVAPVQPGEFVIFRVGQKTADAVS
jgi:phage tail sheath protein FI